jgi:hypothetical protein
MQEAMLNVLTVQLGLQTLKNDIEEQRSASAQMMSYFHIKK